MNTDNKHHHHDQTHHPDQGAEDSILKDPVCGMALEPAKRSIPELNRLIRKSETANCDSLVIKQ
jgi:CRISPR/Cas system-associated protein Csm6